MKKNLIIVLILIINQSFSQENIFKKMPFFIGDKIDKNIYLNPIKFESKNFSLLSYSASDNNIINRLIFNIYNYKGLERIESYFQSDSNIEKISRLYWEKGFVDCYVDKQKDIEYVIKYDSEYDTQYTASMNIISYKLLDSNLEKTYDELNKQTIYFTTRHCYLGLDSKESVYFNFRFNSNESNVYVFIDMIRNETYDLGLMHFSIKNEPTIKKSLTLIENKDLNNGLINESYLLILTNEEVKKINNTEEVAIKIIGENKNIEFEMTYPQKMSIRDILISNDYKRLFKSNEN